jgi:hypothetical protein
MKDNAELDTYSTSEEVNEDSDAMVVMKDDAELDTYSTSGHETKVKSSILSEELGICNMQAVVRKVIVNAVTFEEMKAAVIETIVKNKVRGEEVAGRVEK